MIGNDRVAKLYRNDDCADLAVSKQATAAPVRPGATVTYTLAITNTGDVTATATIITDTLPTDIALTGVTTSTTGGFTLTQLSGPPKLAWTAGDVPSERAALSR